MGPTPLLRHAAPPTRWRGVLPGGQLAPPTRPPRRDSTNGRAGWADEPIADRRPRHDVSQQRAAKSYADPTTTAGCLRPAREREQRVQRPQPVNQGQNLLLRPALI